MISLTTRITGIAGCVATLRTTTYDCRNCWSHAQSYHWNCRLRRSSSNHDYCMPTRTHLDFRLCRSSSNHDYCMPTGTHWNFRLCRISSNHDYCVPTRTHLNFRLYRSSSNHDNCMPTRIHWTCRLCRGPSNHDDTLCPLGLQDLHELRIATCFVTCRLQVACKDQT